MGEVRMIEVPADAFALLFAWCFISQIQVPPAVREHPDWPARRDFQRGHLTQALRPFAERAIADLAAQGDVGSSQLSGGTK